eukprot:424617_1
MCKDPYCIVIYCAYFYTIMIYTIGSKNVNLTNSKGQFLNKQRLISILIGSCLLVFTKIKDADPTQSSLYEYITKELNNIKIYQIIKSVVDPSYNISTNNKPKDEEKTTLIENKQNDINIKEQPSQPQLLITNADIDKIRTNHRLSLQIVDGSLVDIPDNIPYKYYENIDGITYLLNHNKELIDNQDYNHMFWSFWEEFINDEPTFSNISNDLQNKEGQIIICINDHPPSERALPILERIVYELQLKRLKSNNKKIKKSKIDSYKQNAI